MKLGEKCVLCQEKEVVAVVEGLKVCKEHAAVMLGIKIKQINYISREASGGLHTVPLSVSRISLSPFSSDKVKENSGEVYFDKKTNRFFQMRKKHENCLICGGFTSYYADSKTNITTQLLSKNYLRNCVKIVELNKHPELWEYDGIGWRVHKKEEERKNG